MSKTLNMTRKMTSCIIRHLKTGISTRKSDVTMLKLAKTFVMWRAGTVLLSKQRRGCQVKARCFRPEVWWRGREQLLNRLAVLTGVSSTARLNRNTNMHTDDGADIEHGIQNKRPQRLSEKINFCCPLGWGWKDELEWSAERIRDILHEGDESVSFLYL